MNRLFLRFGNQVADTIPEHLAVIKDLGYTWWGWWAKAWERVPSDLQWQEIASSIEAKSSVGLFDRRALRFYIAEVDDLQLANGIARIQSPEPAATPRYYSDEVFPVWFRITKISEITETKFLDNFGFVPQAEDQTLFWADPTDAHEPHWLDVVETSLPNILHISDLHFGDDTAYSPSSRSEGHSSLEDQLSRYIRDERLEVGILLLTGDLITRGVERYYRDVTTFLDNLLQRLGLERKHVVVVPGNHDLWMEDASAFTYAHDYAHELGYRAWHDSFFAEPGAALSLERLRVFDCSDETSIGFVQVNSARLRERETMEFGYVGGHRYEPLLRALDDIDRPSIARFFALHHHILPVPSTERIMVGKPISVTVDAGEIVERLQCHRVQCVFHGHQHLPFIGSTGRMSFHDHRDPAGHLHPLAVIGCGSTGAKYDRLSEGFRSNTFNLYQVTQSKVPSEISTMAVRIVQTGPGAITRRWAETQVSLGPQRGT